MTTNSEKQVIFAFKPADQTPDGIPILVFVMPEASWDYMKNGLGHDFDLSKIGIPLKILIGRTKTHRTGMEELRKAGLIGDETKDVRSQDMGFKEPTKQ